MALAQQDDTADGIGVPIPLDIDAIVGKDEPDEDYGLDAKKSKSILNQCSRSICSTYSLSFSQ